VFALLDYNWGYLTQIRGRYDEALAGMQRAIEVDPLYTAAGDSVGWVLYYAGRYDARCGVRPAGVFRGHPTTGSDAGGMAIATAQAQAERLETEARR
jgi:hypothetical protein